MPDRHVLEIAGYNALLDDHCRLAAELQRLQALVDGLIRSVHQLGYEIVLAEPPPPDNRPLVPEFDADLRTRGARQRPFHLCESLSYFAYLEDLRDRCDPDPVPYAIVRRCRHE